MRTGWFRQAHIKSEACYRLRLLLTHRRNLDLENAIRHSLKAFGIRIKGFGRGGFAQAVREAVASDPLVTELIVAMLNARAALWKKYLRLHELVVKFVAGHELCRHFDADPGCRAGCGAELCDRDRRSFAVQEVSRCGRLFWVDVAALAVRQVDRCAGADQQGGRCGPRSMRRRPRC
jgi:transposase